MYLYEACTLIYSYGKYICLSEVIGAYMVTWNDMEHMGERRG